MIYGRHPSLPADLIFGLSNEKEPCEYSDYVQTLRECLTCAYDQADRMSRHVKDFQKKHYDKKVKSTVFQQGDRVMVKLCYVEGKQKLADRWEQHPHVVVKKQPGIPVYVVCPVDGVQERVVHCNLLSHCMFFPVEKSHQLKKSLTLEKYVNLSQDLLMQKRWIWRQQKREKVVL